MAEDSSENKIFNGVLSLKPYGNIAVITLLFGEEGKTEEGSKTFPWGTAIKEHRINPTAIEALHQALDCVLESDFRAVVVTGEGRFFCNGLDLQWIDANPSRGEELQLMTEKLLARLLVFPLPTIAGVNGHMCAAGAMLGLAFDYRIMIDNKNWFFIPVWAC
mmetsp:Transcript_8387/g.10064  ORF Transcript_8387/g.10064 Transcript_8387/m.10064 type:complete len:162 (+) Transcript_8387:98-583(+)